MTLEEGNSVARRPEIWAMAGAERQQLGRCMAGVVLSVSAQPPAFASACCD